MSANTRNQHLQKNKSKRCNYEGGCVRTEVIGNDSDHESS